MKIRGTLTAVLILLAGIFTALAAQLSGCSDGQTQTRDDLLSLPGHTSREPALSSGSVTGSKDVRPPVSTPAQTAGDTQSSDPGTGPATVGTSAQKPETDPAETTQKPETDPSGPAAPQSGPDFVLDLSGYEKYMNPTGGDWSDEYLLLINAGHPVAKDYEKTLPFLKNIVSMDSVSAYKHEHYRTGQQLNETALQALTAMFLEAKAEGISDLYSTSAYRTYTYQTSVFNRNVSKTEGYHCEVCGTDWIGKSNICPSCKTKSTTLREVSREEKEANVATYSCRPGTSDHQSGLAVDIIQSSLPAEYMSLIQEFGDTDAGKWLAANAYKFGFVLRFPADKEDVTGIIYEPWHFRFVGRYHATRMKEMNLCLEEYVDYLEQTGYFEN